MDYYEIFEFAAAYAIDVPPDLDSVERSPSTIFDLDEPMPGVLVGRFGAHAVTREFAQELRGYRFTGFRFGNASARVSEYSDRGDISIPELELLIVYGTPMVDDFSVNEWGDLVVSQRVFDVLVTRDQFVLEGSSKIGSR
ncbi:hypothetical protein L5G32_12415 [Gordonia sp. HY002]|uniref:hypothetical protein n=1 Tax=Gordonia zhenghanii TaxID=2911516 RepID=UPI001EF041C6|nr:hypothetical protein [Gordonia zhenghanii]MCF8571072.1 hypothetical protein [Gordonia zhenghanii]MCF8606237.1 hypothetical protein [Gordonia zhenghanii]